MIARAWHGTVALIVAAALLLQVWIAVRASATPPGHAVGALRGTALPWRVLRVLSFFTIQSNILAGVASATLALRPDRDGPRWRVLRVDSLIGIAVTGIVYGTVLARVHTPVGWQQTSTNAALHYVVPAMTVVGWLLLGPRPRVTWRALALSLAWPTAFLLYTLAAGARTGWYPYPFLDVATHGYPRVLLNSVGVLAVLAAVATALGWGDRRLPAAPSAASAPVPAPRAARA